MVIAHHQEETIAVSMSLSGPQKIHRLFNKYDLAFNHRLPTSTVKDKTAHDFIQASYIDNVQKSYFEVIEEPETFQSGHEQLGPKCGRK